MARSQPSERDARYRKRRRAGYPPAVSEGDSWFDYPFYRNIIDVIDDAELFAHYRLEEVGDTVGRMIGTKSSRANLRTIIEEIRPVCLLFSGGGNDLAADAGKLIQSGQGSTAAKYLVPEELDGFITRQKQAFEGMIAELGLLTPIFAHGYDNFTPSPKPVRFNGIKTGIGPWIYPAMVKVGIEAEDLRRGVARIIVTRFKKMLQGLESDHPLDFVYVDLEGILEVDLDWQNEIHPTREGFVKVADRFIEVLKRRLPELHAARIQRNLA